MLHALLHDKLSVHLDKNPFDIEDLLTSVVFGACRYLPPERALLPFLARARDAAGQPLALHDVVAVDYAFWRTWEALVAPSGALVAPASQPEVLLTFTCRDGSTARLVVEAKLHSGKSSQAGEGAEVEDQLGKYWVQLRARAGSARALGVVYVTKDIALPRDEFVATQAELAVKGQAPAPLYWVSWRSFAQAVSAGGDPLLTDVITLLAERWNLVFTPMAPWQANPTRAPRWTYGPAWGAAPPLGPRWAYPTEKR